MPRGGRIPGAARPQGRDDPVQDVAAAGEAARAQPVLGPLRPRSHGPLVTGLRPRANAGGSSTSALRASWALCPSIGMTANVVASIGRWWPPGPTREALRVYGRHRLWASAGNAPDSVRRHASPSVIVVDDDHPVDERVSPGTCGPPNIAISLASCSAPLDHLPHETPRPAAPARGSENRPSSLEQRRPGSNAPPANAISRSLTTRASSSGKPAMWLAARAARPPSAASRSRLGTETQHVLELAFCSPLGNRVDPPRDRDLGRFHGRRCLSLPVGPRRAAARRNCRPPPATA